jgi:N-acetyl sugar amidotransferase
MDGSADELVLDEHGVCNFCHQAQKALAEIERDKVQLPAIIERIKKAGEGKKYDILIGLSGGVDSSYALVKTIELGLRPLCFSIDNGWNEPMADENIMRIVEGLKVPFYRYVFDTDTFKELQSAFIRAGLRNIEIPTDHIIMAATYEMAMKYGIKYIVSGGNVTTESIMPKSWGYEPRDLVHIKDVYKEVTGKKLSGIPTCSLLKFNWYRWMKGIKTVYLLDFLGYNRKEAIKTLKDRFGWKDYGGKHEESVFTKWFQNFYIFTKFGIDKRKAHLSSEINSGQITRSEAKAILAERPIYPQLGIEERVMAYRKRSHNDFKKDEWLFNLIGSIIRLIPYSWRS